MVDAARTSDTLAPDMREGRDLGKQLNIRLGAAELERLDKLAEAIAASTPGVDVSRSSAARAALLAGLEALEERLAPPRSFAEAVKKHAAKKPKA